MRRDPLIYFIAAFAIGLYAFLGAAFCYNLMLWLK